MIHTAAATSVTSFGDCSDADGETLTFTISSQTPAGTYSLDTTSTPTLVVASTSHEHVH